MSSQGVSRLAQQHIALAKRAVPQQDWLALGTIRADRSLLVDGFDVPFPLGSWYALRPLRLSGLTLVASEAGSGPHTHDVVLPAVFSRPGANARVLVAWVNGGNDPVVLGEIRRGA